MENNFEVLKMHFIIYSFIIRICRPYCYNSYSSNVNFTLDIIIIFYFKEY